MEHKWIYNATIVSENGPIKVSENGLEIYAQVSVLGIPHFTRFPSESTRNPWLNTFCSLSSNPKENAATNFLAVCNNATRGNRILVIKALLFLLPCFATCDEYVHTLFINTCQWNLFILHMYSYFMRIFANPYKSFPKGGRCLFSAHIP